MAKFTAEGLDTILMQLEARGRNVNGAVNHALNAAAKIMKEEMQQTMHELNLEDKGDLIKSIKSSGIKKDGDNVKSVSIAPSGTDRKGVRNMTKAMIAEYGKSGRAGKKFPARPWKTIAEERGFPKAQERMSEIFHEEMNKTK